MTTVRTKSNGTRPVFLTADSADDEDISGVRESPFLKTVVRKYATNRGLPQDELSTVPSEGRKTDFVRIVSELGRRWVAWRRPRRHVECDSHAHEDEGMPPNATKIPSLVPVSEKSQIVSCTSIFMHTESITCKPG